MSTLVDDLNQEMLVRFIESKPHKLKEIEKIVHPILWKEREKEISRISKSSSRSIIIESPLFFETLYGRGVVNYHFSILMVSDSLEQERRVMLRKNMTKEKLSVITSLQLPASITKILAGFIIKNGGNKFASRKAIRSIISRSSDN